jgi:hypothetical protein
MRRPHEGECKAQGVAQNYPLTDCVVRPLVVAGRHRRPGEGSSGRAGEERGRARPAGASVHWLPEQLFRLTRAGLHPGGGLR